MPKEDVKKAAQADDADAGQDDVKATPDLLGDNKDQAAADDADAKDSDGSADDQGQDGDTADADKGQDGDKGDDSKDGKDDDAKAAEGVPDSWEGYEVKLPEGFVEEPQLVEPVKRFAHENGLSQEAFNKLVGVYTGHVAGLINQMEQKAVEDLAALQEEWGSNFEPTVASAQKVARRLAKEVPGFADFMNVTGMSRQPMMIRAFAVLAKGMTESGTVDGDTHDTPKDMDRTPSGAPKFSYKK